jgi:hypothetical protein
MWAVIASLVAVVGTLAAGILTSRRDERRETLRRTEDERRETLRRTEDERRETLRRAEDRAERRREERRLLYAECLQVLHEARQVLAGRRYDPDPPDISSLDELERIERAMALIAPEPVTSHLLWMRAHASSLLLEFSPPASLVDRHNRDEAYDLLAGRSLSSLMRADLAGKPLRELKDMARAARQPLKFPLTSKEAGDPLDESPA